MRITKRQLRQVIREQVDSIVNSVTAFDVVDALKRLGSKSIFAVYMTPRRDDRFEINDRCFGIVDGDTVTLFDAYTPRRPIAIFDTRNKPLKSIAREIDTKIKYLKA